METAGIYVSTDGRVFFVDPTVPGNKALILGHVTNSLHSCVSTNKRIMEDNDMTRLPLDQGGLRRALLDTYGDEK